MGSYQQALKEFLMSDKEPEVVTEELNAKLLAATRSEKARIIQTLAHLNVSDELLGLGVIYLSKTHGLQISFNSGDAGAIVIGAEQLKNIALSMIFTKPDPPAKKDIQ